MVAVILGNRYSEQTIEKIVNYYKSFEINNIVICQSGTSELIEEVQKDGQTIIYVKVNDCENNLKQIKIIKSLINDESFFLTFGKNFCDIDLKNLYKFHKSNSKAITIATVKKSNYLHSAGFMIFDIDIFDYITDEMDDIEKDLISRIAQDDEIAFYLFEGKCENIFTKRKMYQIN